MCNQLPIVRVFALAALIFSSVSANLPIAAAQVMPISNPAGAPLIQAEPRSGSPAQEPLTPSSSAGPFGVFLPVVMAGGSGVTTVTIPAGGGSVSFNQDQIRIDFPSGAASGPITLITRLLDFPPVDGLVPLSPVIDLRAYDAAGKPITVFNQMVTLTFSYAELDFDTWPTMYIVTETNQGWTNAGTKPVTGQKALKASVDHFSRFALTSLDNTYNLMVGDESGSIYYFDPYFGMVYYLSPGGQPAVYADLSAVISGGDTDFGGMARNPATNDLYIGTDTTVYRLAGSKTLSTLFTIPNPELGNRIGGLHYSQSYTALFVSSIYSQGGKWYGGAYQVDPVNGVLVKTFDKGSRGLVTDSKKRIFALDEYVPRGYNHLFPDGVGMLNIWPDAENQPETWIELPGFLGPRGLAADRADNIYVLNRNAGAISVVGGADPAVIGAIYGVLAPVNFAAAGSSLVVQSQGGLRLIPMTRRDPSPYSPMIMNLPSISGAGSALLIYNADPVPAHNTLRINGKMARDLWSVIPARHTVSYNLENFAVSGPALIPYNQPTRQVELSVSGKEVVNAGMGLPEVGMTQVVDIYTEAVIARGDWGVFIQTSPLISLEGLFPDFTRNGLQGTSMFYQFNQLGDFHFSDNATPPRILTVHVVPVVIDVDQGSCSGGGSRGRGSVVPQEGLLYRYRGVTMEIPPGALPGSATYELKVTECNLNYPGKDAVSKARPSYQFGLVPEPTSLLQPLTIRTPYDPGLPEPPVAGFYDPKLGDVVPLPYALDKGKVVITLPSGNYQNGIPSLAEAPALPGTVSEEAPGALGRLGTILSGLWWGVGLPNSYISSAHFLVYYNTKDCTQSYAQSVLDDLEAAYTQYNSKGYSVPTNTVLVKIAPWIAAKSRPGATVGTDGYYHLFFNNALSSADMDITTAHEMFHVSQHESIGVVGFPLTSNWWLEGTATWAEYSMYPSNNSYLLSIGNSMNFPNTAFANWGGLSVEQQYATMAVAEYMVQKKGSTVIQTVNTNIQAGMTLNDALQSAVGGNWSTFYEEWARDYWQQKYDPVKSWALDPSASQLVNPATAVTTILNQPALPALSSGMVRGVYKATLPNLPASFISGTDSVVRLPASCNNSDVIVYDKKKQVQQTFIGVWAPENGQAVRKVSTYPATNPLYFVYINSAAASTCALKILWEAPTLDSLIPNVVQKGVANTIIMYGAGFGIKTGKVYAGGQTYSPTAWGDNMVQFSLSAQSTPGSINVQVQAPTGALSNPVSLLITP